MSEYEQGYNAYFYNGMCVSDNPFEPEDERWYDWDRGWRDAINDSWENSE